MLDRDQDLAVQALAHAIAHCLEAVGPACTARLLGTIALDLIETDAHPTEAKHPAPDPDEQEISEPRTGIRFRHPGASQRHRRPAGYPSATR